MSTGENGGSRRETETKRIALPERTRTRLEEWLRTQQQVQALIDATLMATRDALGVPDEWQIRNVADGFVAPDGGARPDPEAAGAMEMVREAVG